jgi:hypothetical protein
MAYPDTLSIVSDWAAILTAVVAIFAYGKYRCDQHSKMRALEKHLKAEKDRSENEGKRTTLHLMGHLSMTEAEVLSASFRSKNIMSFFGTDSNGRADVLLFQYDEN